MMSAGHGKLGLVETMRDSNIVASYIVVSADSYIVTSLK